MFKKNCTIGAGWLPLLCCCIYVTIQESRAVGCQNLTQMCNGGWLCEVRIHHGFSSKWQVNGNGQLFYAKQAFWTNEHLDWRLESLYGKFRIPEDWQAAAMSNNWRSAGTKLPFFARLAGTKLPDLRQKCHRATCRAPMAILPPSENSWLGNPGN